MLLFDGGRIIYLEGENPEVFKEFIIWGMGALYQVESICMKMACVINLSRWVLILYNKNENPSKIALSKKLKIVQAGMIVAFISIVLLYVFYYLYRCLDSASLAFFVVSTAIDLSIVFFNSLVFFRLYLYHSRLLMKYEKVFTREEVEAVEDANKTIAKVIFLCNLTILMNVSFNLY